MNVLSIFEHGLSTRNQKIHVTHGLTPRGKKAWCFPSRLISAGRMRSFAPARVRTHPALSIRPPPTFPAEINPVIDPYSFTYELTFHDWKFRSAPSPSGKKNTRERKLPGMSGPRRAGD